MSHFCEMAPRLIFLREYLARRTDCCEYTKKGPYCIVHQGGYVDTWGQSNCCQLKRRTRSAVVVGCCLIIGFLQCAQWQPALAGRALLRFLVTPHSNYVDIQTTDTLDDDISSLRVATSIFATIPFVSFLFCLRLFWLHWIRNTPSGDLVVANVLLHWRAPPTAFS
jgi:hypothetical protein